MASQFSNPVVAQIPQGLENWFIASIHFQNSKAHTNEIKIFDPGAYGTWIKVFDFIVIIKKSCWIA